MNNQTRDLINLVCDGNIRKAQQQARAILENSSTKKDARFQQDMLRKLDAKQSHLIELPYNLKELLIAEDVTTFPMSRFILRASDMEAVDKTLATFYAATKLADLDINYVPALMLYGVSGCGKTMLARYIAYKSKLPFVYVRFSNMVSSYLGSTQSNIAKVLEYARTSPCVLCFDEIDAVGMARGQKNDVGEMNRVVIALMQEMDMLPNNVIIVGATNRYDRLDEALIRRFSIHHEVKALGEKEALILADKFFSHVGYSDSERNWLSDWCSENIDGVVPASQVINKCTQKVISDVIERQTNYSA